MKKNYFVQQLISKGYLSVFIFYLLVTSDLVAQETSPTFDSIWAAQFQTAIDNAVASGDIKGVSVAITFPGEGTFIGVGGESTAGVPITPDMRFTVASNTKLFTAVILMKLQEMGVLSLDDHLDDWLLAYPFIDASVSIRQLLSHQTGFCNFYLEEPSEPGYLEDTFYTPENTLALIGPPYFLPGEAWDYSNTNYILAGLIIEAATGASYTENLHTYIFDPLDMDSTFLGGYEAPNGTIPNGWYMGEDLGNIPNTKQISLAWASGAIYSTASEMVQWYDNLFAGNIINQASLAEITKFEPSSMYGLGLKITNVPWLPDDDVWWHNGVSYGCFSAMGYDVKGRGSLCLLANDENYLSALIPLIIELYNNYPLQQNDAGILSIISPTSERCESLIQPEVELKNFGSDLLTSATINYQIDSGALNIFNWTGSLIANNTATITLPDISVASGFHTLKCYTSNPNGSEEGYNYNDAANSSFNVDNGSSLTSLNEGFEGAQFPPAGWVSGSNRILDWGRSSLSLLSGTGCAVKNNWNDGSGRAYDLELPLVDLSAMNNPVLSFSYAYASCFGYNDGLTVMVSEDCGESYHIIFHKSGHGLKTATEVYPDEFFPEDNEWRLKSLNLSAFSGEVFIKFKATNDNGSNIYLDNVILQNLSDVCAAPTDLDAVQITAESAKVIWQFHGNAIQFDVYYREAEASTWLHKIVTGNKHFVVLSELLPERDYDWYVIATCSSGLSPESELSFFTTDPFWLHPDPVSPPSFIMDIFPNPADEFTTVFVKFDEPSPLQMRLMDIVGNLLYTMKEKVVSGSYSLEIDLSRNTPGLYFIEIKTGDQVYTQRLAVQ